MSRYSFITMRKDIECLGVRSHQNPFLWEEDSNLHKQLIGRYPYGAPKKNHINCLTEYCWQVYQKSVASVGVMRIGRQADVWKEEIFKQYLMDKGENLWARQAKGNILVIDKWSGVLNDAWLLGGIHRYADFHLMSYLAPINLWNYEAGYHVVTAREILGLLHFGYEMRRNTTGIMFKCRSYQHADNANLLSYETLMKESHKRGPSSITKLLAEPTIGLYQQIHARRV